MKLGNIAKIDSLMSTARDCPQRPQGATYRYLLCSTARCGSNLISDMLHQTGMAGDPMEYFNPRYMAGYLRANQGNGHETRVNVPQYLTDIERRRTTPNGHFGIKVHFLDLKGVYKDKPDRMLEFLHRFDAIVHLRRRDKVAQAVSLYKAKVTQIWSSQDYDFLDKDDPRLKLQASFDPVAIGHALADTLVQDYGWEQLLKSAGCSSTELWYEDFVQDYAGSSEKLLKQLAIPEAIDTVSAPATKRQGSDDDPLLKAFRQTLGV